jgi:flagellar hook-basal body complex protein FliE
MSTTRQPDAQSAPPAPPQQEGAAQAAQQLAAGTASDPSQAVLAVERARLAMQLAAQIRTKVVESVNDIFHTQV